MNHFFLSFSYKKYKAIAHFLENRAPRYFNIYTIRLHNHFCEKVTLKMSARSLPVFISTTPGRYVPGLPIQKTSGEGTVLTVPYAVPTEATVPIHKTSGEGTVQTVPYALQTLPTALTVPQTEKVLDIAPRPPPGCKFCRFPRSFFKQKSLGSLII